MKYPNASRPLGIALGIAMACVIGNAHAAKPREIDRDAVINHAAASGERFWRQIAHDEPYPTMGIRKVFSFVVQLSSDANETATENESWHTGHGDRWRWQAVGLNRSKEPMPLDLPAGLVCLRFRVRETGTKIDRLFLTPDPNARPE